MAVPYTFGSATTSIPLSQLDSNFATTITLGNTAIQLGNTVTTLNNMTLANVTISSGTSSLTSTSISNGTSNVTVNSSGGNITLGTAGTTAITIDTSQNVLVGTTTSTNNIRLNEKIAVVTAGNGNFGGISNTSYNGTSAGVAPLFDFQRSRGTTDGSMTAVASGDTLGYSAYRGSDGTGFIDSSLIIGDCDGTVATNQVPGRLVFKTASSAGSMTERMRIDSSGNLCVNSTSPVLSGKITSSFAGNTLNGMTFNDTASASGAGFCIFSIGGTSIGSISRVTSTSAVAYNTTSDERLKSNISDSQSVLDKLMTVKVRQYDWTEGQVHQDYGFIAQELEPVLSGIVSKGKTDEDMWQLDYAKLTPHLVKAIQELKAINDTQDETINALTARIVALESK